MDGQTLRDHLKSHHAKTGEMPRRLAEAPQCPEGCYQLWRDFLALHHGRGSTGFGPARISFSDILAYQQVRGIRLSQWDISTIQRADTAFLEHCAEEKKRNGS